MRVHRGITRGDNQEGHKLGLVGRGLTPGATRGAQGALKLPPVVQAPHPPPQHCSGQPPKTFGVAITVAVVAIGYMQGHELAKC